MGKDVVQRSRAIRDGRWRGSSLDQRRESSKRNFILKTSDAGRTSATDGLSHRRKGRGLAIGDGTAEIWKFQAISELGLILPSHTTGGSPSSRPTRLPR